MKEEEYHCPVCGSKYFRTAIGWRYGGDIGILQCKGCSVYYWRESGKVIDRQEFKKLHNKN